MDLARASVGWFAANVASAITNFFAVVYFSRELGASVLGVYFLFFSILQVLNLIANAGLAPATIKRISEGNGTSELLSASLIIRLIFFLIVCISLIIFKDYLSSYLNVDLTLPMISILFLLQFSDLVRELLQGTYKVGISALVDFSQQMSKVIAQILLLSHGLLGLVWGLWFGVLFSIVYGTAVARPNLKRPKLADFSSLFRFSKYSYGTAMGGVVYDWLGLLVIGFYLNSVDAGIYGVCWSLSVVFLLFSQAISNAIYPKISTLAVKERWTEISSIFEDSISYGPLITVPAFFGALALGEHLLSIVYGDEFGSGATILIILMATRMLQSIQMITTRTIEGLDKPDIVFKINIGTTLLNIITTIFLVYLFGPIGAALGAFLTIFVSASYNMYFLRNLLYFKLKNELLWEIISSVVMFGSILFINNYVSIKGTIQLFSVIIFGVCIYFFMILVLSSDFRGKILRLMQKY